MRNVAMRRKKTRKTASDEVSVAEEEAAEYLKHVENRFRTLLSPVEAYIMGIQSTLVWEIPSFSGCVFIAVNIVFWLATRMRFFHLLGLTGLTVVFVDIWIHKIWPEIRVPPSPSEDSEEWTLVHPKLLSVPEISRHLSRLWITISGVIHWLVVLRCTSHAKFFVVMMLVLIAIGVVGLYLSGIALLYIIVMSVFIIPPLIYYNLLKELYDSLEPTILRVEKMFNVKRTRTKKKTEARPAEPESEAFITAFTLELDHLLDGKKKGGDGSAAAEGCASDSDEGLEDFVPQASTVSKTLSKATNNESEEESSGHTPGLLTPDALSQGPSRDISDTDSIGDDTNFAKGLKSIPDFDDSRLDDSMNDDHGMTNEDELPDLDVSNDDHDLLPEDGMFLEEVVEQPVSVPQSDSMHFVQSHFKDSSESDHDIEGELAEGLAFPDIQDELDSMAKDESASSATIATEMVSKTVSTLMSSTMSGLSKLSETASRLGETVRSAAKSATSGEAEGAGVPLPEGDETDATSSGSLRKTITESTDSDILAEFEFLEQEDLDVLDEDESNKEPIASSSPPTDNKEQQSGVQE